MPIWPLLDRSYRGLGNGVTLTKVSCQPLNLTLVAEEQIHMTKVRKWSDIEEQELKQKLRVNWVPGEDANTKYFYAQMKLRNNRNTITSIHDANRSDYKRS